MNILPTTLEGVVIIEPNVFTDERGAFVKPYHKETFEKAGLSPHFEESIYSISHKNVIRGMHFQIPPQDHAKFIYVPSGRILDVVLDIRKGSPTYGQHFSVELSAENKKMIYIPSGFAHGFLSLADNSYTTYFQSTMRSADHEAGIHINSFGMNWGIENPILSKRDKEFPALETYQTPFIYKPA